MPRCGKAQEVCQRYHRCLPHYPYNLLRSQSLLSPSLRQLFGNFPFRIQCQKCLLSFSCIYTPFTLYARSLLTMRICYDEFSYLIEELKTTVREPAAVPVVGLQGCWSTSLFWDRNASVPVWCSSASNVFKYSNCDRSHADRWASVHCLRRFNLLWGLPQDVRFVSTFYEAFLRTCASYIIDIKHTFILKNCS